MNNLKIRAASALAGGAILLGSLAATAPAEAAGRTVAPAAVAAVLPMATLGNSWWNDGTNNPKSVAAVYVRKCTSSACDTIKVPAGKYIPKGAKQIKTKYSFVAVSAGGQYKVTDKWRSLPKANQIWKVTKK